MADGYMTRAQVEHDLEESRAILDNLYKVVTTQEHEHLRQKVTAAWERRVEDLETILKRFDPK